MSWQVMVQSVPSHERAVHSQPHLVAARLLEAGQCTVHVLTDYIRVSSLSWKICSQLSWQVSIKPDYPWQVSVQFMFWQSVPSHERSVYSHLLWQVSVGFMSWQVMVLPATSPFSLYVWIHIIREKDRRHPIEIKKFIMFYLCFFHAKYSFHEPVIFRSRSPRPPMVIGARAGPTL